MQKDKNHQSQELQATTKAIRSAINSAIVPGNITALSSLFQGIYFPQSILSTYKQQELFRASISTIQDLLYPISVPSVLGGTPMFQELKLYSDLVEKQFVLPKAIELSGLTGQLNADIAGILHPHSMLVPAAFSAMQGMQTPWLNTTDMADSILGFTRLQGIGSALQAMPSFTSTLSTVLRSDLGDWRGKFKWPEGIFTDPFIRTSFYTSRGLNPTLTLFPPSAFDEIITGSDLGTELIPLADEYAPPSAEAGTEGEHAFERTNKAHDILQRLEAQIRKFIDDQMRDTFGVNWIKHQVRPEIVQVWNEKQGKDIANKRTGWSLIAYADFTDYEAIITRRDNWEKVFKQTFRNKESLRESFQRLYPIRICTMHARPITQDDELFLRVEVLRIRKAIGI